MKKILVAIAITVLGSSAAFAASNITATKHNLSSGASTSQVRSNTSQICAFCHTPHNAVPNVPLWNRDQATSTYLLYTSSATLSSAAKNAALSSTSISLLCMSCHDGTVDELGSRVNAVPSDVSALTMTDGTVAFSAGGANLGADLTNDHPIGFSYATAQTQDANLRVASDAITQGAMFFNGSQMECASCHLVHDNTFKPFLRTTNVGSNLCLACHVK